MSNIRDLRLCALTIGIAGLVVWQPAAAATFTLAKDDGVDFIYIEGEIKPGDEDHFRRLAIGSDKAAVDLSSPGGTLVTALEIGKTIQLQGFATFVPDDAECTSACALIWIAGSPRYLAPKSHIGFHASYTDENGHLEEAGVANALVGRYPPRHHPDPASLPCSSSAPAPPAMS